MERAVRDRVQEGEEGRARRTRRARWWARGLGGPTAPGGHLSGRVGDRPGSAEEGLGLTAARKGFEGGK